MRDSAELGRRDVGLDLKRTAPTAALAVSCKKFSSEEAQEKVVRLTLKVFEGLDHINFVRQGFQIMGVGRKMGFQGPGRAFWAWIFEKHISIKEGKAAVAWIQYQSTDIDIDSLKTENFNRLISA
jgi:hypothetical protein